MQNYELLCILPGTLTEEEVKPVMENVKDALSKSDIEVANATFKNCGKNRLAYPVKHIRYGFFYIVSFEAESENLAVLNKRLRENTELLRFIITKYNAKERETSEKRYGSFQNSIETVSKIDTESRQKSAPASATGKKEKFVSKAKKQVEKIDLKEIDEKLDQILESDLEKV